MKYLIGTIAAAALTIGTCGYGAQSCTYSDGDRVGHINKFSEKGFVFKTNEGQLALSVDGNVEQGRGAWTFSVKDDNIAQKVQEAMDSGKKVRLTYEEKLWVPFWDGDTDYLIVDVNYVGEDQK